MLRLRTAVTVGFLALNLCACAAIAVLPVVLPVPTPDVTIDADHGYIYGRFLLTTPSSSTFGGDLFKIGLVIAENDTGVPRTVQFQRTLRVSVIAVKPGTYKLLKFLQEGTLREALIGEAVVEEKLTKAFSVEAGKAYYIGDFFVESNRRSLFSKIDWSLERVVNEYDLATAQLKKNFPAFEKMLTASVAYRFP